MPRFDRTGPLGYGPLTGGGFGCCGRRRGRGAIHGYANLPSARENLQQKASYLKAELKEVEQLLAEAEPRDGEE